MKINEIFQELANHMIQGIALHQELTNYYDFLHLQKYKKNHEHHYFEESKGYMKLYHYYIEHYNKLIEVQNKDKINIIPSLWYKHKREDIDMQLKQQSVENAMQIWINWERETKKFYQKKYQELIQLGEVGAAIFLQSYICDVEKELKCAENEDLNLKATNYDMVMIIEKNQQ